MFYKIFLLKNLFLCLLLLIAVPTIQATTNSEKEKAIEYIRSYMLQTLYYNAEPIIEISELGQRKFPWEKTKQMYYGKALHKKDLQQCYNFFSDGIYKSDLHISITGNKFKDLEAVAAYRNYYHNLILLAFIYHGIDKFQLPRFKFKNVAAVKDYKGNSKTRKLLLKGIRHLLSKKPENAYHITYNYQYYANFTASTLSAVFLLLFDEFHGKNNEMKSREKKAFAEVYEEFKDYCRILGYQGDQTTGANWAIRHSLNAFLYLAATGEVKEMDAFIKVHDRSLRRLPFEGVTYDYGFFHHSFTNYWGKYGIHFFQLSAELAMLLDGTPWEFPTWKKRFLRNCVLEGFGPLIYRGNVASFENGKASLTQGVNFARKNAYFDPVKQLISLWGIDKFGGSRKDELLAYCNNFDPTHNYSPEDNKRIEMKKHKVYWYSAKQSHRRKNYAVMVGRMNRWIGSAEREARVSPDISFATSTFYAFGYTSFLTKGPEHSYAKLAWDFTTLPGTTVAIGMRGTFLQKQNKNMKVKYSGGVSDGIYGTGGFICDAIERGDINDERSSGGLHPIVSTKGNFFFDNEVVMLGQDIFRKYPHTESYPSPPWNKGHNNSVWTTIDHTDVRSPFTYNLGGTSDTKIIPKDSTDTSLKIKTKGDVAWFHHDDKGYLILGKNKNVVLEMKNFPAYEARFSFGWYIESALRLGDKRSAKKLTAMRRSIDKKLKTKYTRKNLSGFATINDPLLNIIGEYPLMRLAIDHKVNPLNDSYSYVLLPNVTAKQVEDYAKNLPFTIIKNKKGIQAVVHKNLNMAQILFYQSGGNIKFKLAGKDVHLKASTHSAILLARDENDGKSYRISVAEPTYSKNNLSVTIKGFAFSLDTKKTKKKDANATKVKGNQKNQSTSIKFKLPNRKEMNKNITAHLILL